MFFPADPKDACDVGTTRADNSKLAAARLSEKIYYAIFQAALLLCKAAYHTQKLYFTNFAKRPCPDWTPVVATKERLT